jgi:hypothetical protein
MKFSKYLEFLNPSKFSSSQLIAVFMVSGGATQITRYIGWHELCGLFNIYALICLCIIIARFTQTNFAGKAWNIFLGAVIIDIFRGRK